MHKLGQVVVAKSTGYGVKRNGVSISFATGFSFAHLGISAAYLTVLKNQPLSDSVGYAHASGLSTDRVVVLAAIPALAIATKGIGITAI